jgi:hypothetical protein
MKTIILGMALALTTNIQAKKINILTIGNSFSQSVFSDLKEIAKTEKQKLYINGANLGACSLERHWNNIVSEEKLGKKCYKGKSKSMRDMLELKKWDYVTIQQVSSLSWRKESYHPYAEKIYDYVKKYAPHAEIIIQQTWSYRPDHPVYKAWKLDCNSMYKKLAEAYCALAKELNLRVIPTGMAVQYYREHWPVKFKNYDPKAFKKPELPDVSASIIGNIQWAIHKKTGKDYIGGDRIHLNERGRYLQACVWYGFFFKKDPMLIKYIPEDIDLKEAAFMRKVAKKVLHKKLQEK